MEDGDEVEKREEEQGEEEEEEEEEEPPRWKPLSSPHPRRKGAKGHSLAKGECFSKKWLLLPSLVLRHLHRGPKLLI